MGACDVLITGGGGLGGQGAYCYGKKVTGLSVWKWYRVLSESHCMMRPVNRRHSPSEPVMCSSLEGSWRAGCSLYSDLSTLAVGSECDAHKNSINMYYIRVI